ncbi:hypothetical protein [Allorhizocola rhizosphaerae]|uniref:hypothetical protein n=1 Tax=Allorhizocola rhizosphaerae TaxID=1872709 RepID=UPI0013C35EF9|nr:hypothetical protein [Allorhizocola rhizosphaerae]
MTHPHFVPPNSVPPPPPGPPAFVTPPNVAPVVPSPSPSPSQPPAPSQESVLLEPTSEMPVLGRSNVDAPAEQDHATDTLEAHADTAEAVAEPEAPTDPAASTDPVAAELAEAAEEVAEAKADIENAQAELDEAQSDLAEAGEAIEDSIQDSASLEDALPEDDTVTETPSEVEEPEALAEPALTPESINGDVVAVPVAHDDAVPEEEFAVSEDDIVSEDELVVAEDELAEEDDEDLYEEQYAEEEEEPEVVAALRPGDIEETTIAIWDPDVADRYREAWRDIQAHFVDEPEAALGEAQDLVAEAVQALADALLAEQVSLDPHEDDETPDTEALRIAMRGYRDFLERVLAL